MSKRLLNFFRNYLEFLLFFKSHKLKRYAAKIERRLCNCELCWSLTMI
jgi:hypothetical protein